VVRAAFHVGAHRDDAAPILPLDLRGAGAERHRGHFVERHRVSLRRPNSVLVEVLHRVALVAREAHVDAHLVLPSLQPIRLDPEEGRACLAGQVV
jgi:hypothetical protein